MKLIFLISCLFVFSNQVVWADAHVADSKSCELKGREKDLGFESVFSLFNSYVAIKTKILPMDKNDLKGSCKIQRSSDESGKLRFSDGFYVKLKGEFNLNSCIQEASNHLGRIERMETLIRSEDRYITTVNYSFESDYLKTTGAIDLKDRKRQ